MGREVPRGALIHRRGGTVAPVRQDPAETCEVHPRRVMEHDIHHPLQAHLDREPKWSHLFKSVRRYLKFPRYLKTSE